MDLDGHEESSCDTASALGIASYSARSFKRPKQRLRMASDAVHREESFPGDAAELRKELCPTKQDLMDIKERVNTVEHAMWALQQVLQKAKESASAEVAKSAD